ncbi:hypothetical protein GCM10027018_25820 [Paenibacillus thermoaerophilus]
MALSPASTSSFTRSFATKTPFPVDPLANTLNRKDIAVVPLATLSRSHSAASDAGFKPSDTSPLNASM